MRYWVRLNRQTLGPYAPEDIVRQPAFTPETLVCPEGADDPSAWRRLREVPELERARQGLPAPESGPTAPPRPSAVPKDRKDLAKLIVRALGGSLKKK